VFQSLVPRSRPAQRGKGFPGPPASPEGTGETPGACDRRTQVFAKGFDVDPWEVYKKVK